MRRWFYSIQSRLTAALVVAVMVICFAGFLSFYYSSQLLSTTEIFVKNTLPNIEIANSLERTVRDIGNFSQDLVGSDSVDELTLTYRRIDVLLNRLEDITARISREDAGFDLLKLNWLRQAIHALVLQIFQLEAHRLEIALQRKTLLADINSRLLQEDIPYVAALSSELLHEIPEDYHQGRTEEILRGSLLKMATISSQLELVRDIDEVDALEESFGIGKGVYEQMLAANPSLISVQRTYAAYIYNMELLYDKHRNFLQISDEIKSFSADLEEQVRNLSALALESVDVVFGRFHTSAEKVIEKERLGLYLAAIMTIGASLLLYILFRKVVVSGFSDRLSLISSAMVAEVGSEPPLIPVRGHDEIAEMAKAAEELLGKALRLRNLAAVDQLTQVWNRRQFFELAAIETDRATRKASSSVIMMLDIDHFKNVNDTHGHKFGDKALFEVAQGCKHAIRSIDIFARYGGEEFVLLMPETFLDEGILAAERIRSAIGSNSLTTENGTQVTLTVSIGVVEARLDEVSIEDALGQADCALYHAKEMGRDRVEVYRTEEDAADGMEERA